MILLHGKKPRNQIEYLRRPVLLGGGLGGRETYNGKTAETSSVENALVEWQECAYGDHGPDLDACKLDTAR